MFAHICVQNSEHTHTKGYNMRRMPLLNMVVKNNFIYRIHNLRSEWNERVVYTDFRGKHDPGSAAVLTLIAMHVLNENLLSKIKIKQMSCSKWLRDYEPIFQRNDKESEGACAFEDHCKDSSFPFSKRKLLQDLRNNAMDMFLCGLLCWE